MTTIYAILTELETWTPLTVAEIKAAKASKVTTSNNRHFASLVEEYSNGTYDEDIELLQESILSLL